MSDSQPSAPLAADTPKTPDTAKPAPPQEQSTPADAKPSEQQK